VKYVKDYWGDFGGDFGGKLDCDIKAWILSIDKKSLFRESCNLVFVVDF